MTSITLNAKISPETIEAVVKNFTEHAPTDEKVTAQAESPEKYRVQVKYTELIDSGGIGILVGLFVSARNRGGDLKPVSPNQ